MSPDQPPPPAAAELPAVSVVVPVHDDAARLRACVAALLAQTYPAHLVQLVVVDNNSTEDVFAGLPADPRLVLLSEPVPGSYAARNTGLTAATGEVVAFTDADCVPEPTWLERGVAALTADPGLAMVGGAVELFFASGEPRTSAELYEWRHGFPQRSYLRTQHFAATANVLARRSVVDAVGGFDARLRSRGDADFGQRIHAAGGRQAFAADAVVRHPARTTTDELLTKVRRTSLGVLEADRRAGAGRRHFLRLSVRQVQLLVISTGAVVLLGKPPRRWGQKLRYLGLYARLRWEQVRTYAPAVLDPRGAGLTPRRGGRAQP